ncbi:MAG: hypothetical protein ABI267_07225 [Ginsengibacter sp.]
MKLQANNLLESLTNQELKILTIEIKETVCSNFKKEKKRNFTAADLWNIHRRRKNIYSKRFAF